MDAKPALKVMGNLADRGLGKIQPSFGQKSIWENGSRIEARSGAVLSLGQRWRLARAWFTPARRLLDWQRFTVEEIKAILSGSGQV